MNNEMIMMGGVALLLLALAYWLGTRKGAGRRDVLEEKIRMGEQALSEMKREHEQRLVQVKRDYEERMDQLRKENDRALEVMERWTQRQEEAMKVQLQVVAQDVLRQQSEGLHVANRGQLDGIINPLKEAIEHWQKTVAEAERENQDRMERLDATIRTTLERTEEVGERADRLAKALTGENKTAGNFGEMRLRSMLQDMGFEEPTQFEEQGALRDGDGRLLLSEENGQRLIPDVVLHFADNRDVVIDSKVSITAYERYCNAQSDEEREGALKEHVASVRRHFEGLARKDYSRYIRKGNTRLDFVIMFMPIEGALQLALVSDPTLWNDAYRKGVFITGGQNLYALLRVLQLSWRHMLQVQNQEEIIREANNIVERTQLFHKRLLALEEQFQDVEKAFRDLKISTASEGKSIVTSARNLIRYGAKGNSGTLPPPSL